MQPDPDPDSRIIGSAPNRLAMAARLPDLLGLFPTSYAHSLFPAMCADAFDTMAELMPDGDLPRVPGWRGAVDYEALVARYGKLPDNPEVDPRAIVRSMSADLFAGTTVWRCAQLQYNIGAAPNVVAAAMYALALDLNVYLISDGQAGNAVLAEQSVGTILADLSGVPAERAHGLFTFGGTGTIAYALKAGIRKCAPASVQSGIPADTDVMITEDAHFSHQTVCDWLGIGADRLIVVPADSADRRSDLGAAERLLRERIESGSRVAAFLINGGTTYDHTVDDIAGFAALRDRLVTDYSLEYRPHLHVDSVIGWSWLFFAGCDFDNEDLGVPLATVDLLRRQYDRIRHLHLADSWGIDFHKGVGGCPVDCSYIQFNDKADLVRLRKGGSSGANLHQLAEEFSALSPVDYTLETSRAGGKALAALAALHSVGRFGYRALLARLVNAVRSLRVMLRSEHAVSVLNEHSLGFCTMVRLHPPGQDRWAAALDLRRPDDEAAAAVRKGNAYLRAFFTWDNETRMNVNAGGVVYSFTSRYVTTASGTDLSAIKFYPTSPHTTVERMREAVELLMSRKAEFDRLNPR